MLEFSSRGKRLEKERKRDTNGKGRHQIITLSLFADNMILYLRDQKDCSRKHLDLINIFSK
jgi:hypothetical protein